MEQIYAALSASVSELKRNPTALLNDAHGEPIAILNHNKPTAYLIPAESYEVILGCLEEYNLNTLIKERLAEKSQAINIDLNDL